MEIYSWAVFTDDGGDIRIDIAIEDEGGVRDRVRMWYGGAYELLTPKQARELARDLNAAARAASK